jgi:hypothetical protein
MLVLTAVLLTQTSFVRKFFLSKITAAIETSTNATLSVESLEGNLFSGFVLNKVRLRLRTHTAYDSVDLLRADQIIAHYSLIRFLRSNDIGITSVRIIRPVIQIVKFKGDSTFDISRFMKPSTSKPSSKPSTLVLDLQSVRLQDGRFVMRDYNDTIAPEVFIHTASEKLQALDTRNIDAINLNLDARFFMAGSVMSARVSSLSFRERTSGFVLRQLELSAYKDSLQTRVEEGYLQTDRTSLRFAASIAPPNLFHGGTAAMKGVETHLRINSPSVNAFELRTFIPSIYDYVGGSPGIDLLASGTWDNLKLEHLHLDFHNEGSISINGNLKHLDHPQDFWMDIHLVGKDISNRTLLTYVPALHKTDLSGLGMVQIRELHFIGEPEFPHIFTSSFNIFTSHGDIKGTLGINASGTSMAYKLDAVTDRVDLAGITKKPSMSSDLNLNLKVNAIGTHPKQGMSGSFIVSTTRPSRFGKYAINSLDATALMEHGVITTSHLIAHLPDGSRANLSHGSYDFVSPTHAYAVVGDVDSLPLNKYVSSMKTNPAKLSAILDITGEGGDLDKIAGSASARLSDLSLANQSFDDILADVHISRGLADSGNVVTLASKLADMTIFGKFGVDDIVSIVPQRISAVASAFSNRYFPNRTDSLAPPHSLLACDSIDFAYDLNVKDLRPLAALMPKTMLVANGTIAGRVTGCADDEMNIDAKGNLTSFVMRPRLSPADSSLFNATDTSVGITLTNAKDTTGKDSAARATSGGTRIQLTPTIFEVRLAHVGKDPKEVLDVLDAHVSFKSDSVVRFNSTLLQHPNIRLDYRDRMGRYRIWSILGQHYGVLVDGSADFPQNQFVFTLDTLRFALGRGYRWENEHPAKLTLTTAGEIKLDTLQMAHEEPGDVKHLFTERVQLAADVIHDTIRYVSLKIPELKLNELPLLLPNYSRRFPTLEGSVQKFDVEGKGTFADLQFDADIQLNHLKYNAVTFDTSYAKLSYRNEAIRGKVEMHVDSVQFAIDNISNEQARAAFSSSNKLNLTIDSIPILLALSHGPHYSVDSAAVRKRPMSARLETYHFPIDMAGPFIPTFDQLAGFGDISFKLGGTQEHVIFSGDAKLVDGSFRLPATNVSYTFDGKLSFADQVLTMDNLQLKNVAYDDPAGEANVSGNIRFKGFSLNTFDIVAQTNRLTVLTAASRRTIKTIYGPLTIGTGGGQLRFYGPAESPMLEGNLTILQSFLTIASGQSNASRPTGDGIIYRPFTRPPGSTEDSAIFARKVQLLTEVKDTSLRQAIADSILFPKQDIYAEDVQMTSKDSSVLAANISSSRPPPSMLDRMRYNINLSIGGDVWVVNTMNGLSGFLGAQLRAELKTGGPFSIVRQGDGVYHINGDLLVTENSSYSFYKTFSPATGAISFHDDISNPDINIVAEYIGPHDPGGEVKIKLLITGTERDPHLGMEIYESKGVGGEFERRPGSPADIQEDVLYYLVSGLFKGELSPGQQLGVLEKASTAITSSLATSILNNLLGNSGLTNVIRSVNFETGGSLSSSRLKLTAAYKSIVFRYGSSGLGNPLEADYTIEVPFTFFTPAPWARHLLFDFNYHSPLINQLEAVQQANYIGKFLWRIPLH